MCGPGAIVNRGPFHLPNCLGLDEPLDGHPVFEVSMASLLDRACYVRLGGGAMAISGCPGVPGPATNFSKESVTS